MTAFAFELPATGMQPLTEKGSEYLLNEGRDGGKGGGREGMKKRGRKGEKGGPNQATDLQIVP